MYPLSCTPYSVPPILYPSTAEIMHPYPRNQVPRTLKTMYHDVPQAQNYVPSTLSWDNTSGNQLFFKLEYHALSQPGY